MDLVETAEVLELASVVAAPGGFREVDEGALEASNSGDEVELGGAADRSRQRRLFHAVGEGLESRKRLGDRAGDVDPLGPLERRQQPGDLDPDGGEEAVPPTRGSTGRDKFRLEPGLRRTARGDSPNRLSQVLQELVAEDEGQDLRQEEERRGRRARGSSGRSR